MDIHREVIGTQYYLYGSLHWFPVEFVMNEKMILVNQYLSRLIFEEGLVLCVTKCHPAQSLLHLPVASGSELAKQRGVVIGMEAEEALVLLQKAED